jgi:predicted nucleotidyltransferase
MQTVASATSLDLNRVFGERDKQVLERCVAALRRALPVEEVWLFGSSARGNPGPDSDLDLLVVLADDHGLARPNLACYQAVSRLPNRPPIDILAITRSQWEFEKTHPFGLYGDAYREGVLLYANDRRA